MSLVRCGQIFWSLWTSSTYLEMLIDDDSTTSSSSSKIKPTTIFRVKSSSNFNRDQIDSVIFRLVSHFYLSARWRNRSAFSIEKINVVFCFLFLFIDARLGWWHKLIRIVSYNHRLSFLVHSEWNWRSSDRSHCSLVVFFYSKRKSFEE